MAELSGRGGAALPEPAPPRGHARALWIDGRICRGDDAALSLFDRGARDGEGLFETLRVYGGQPLHWERHMERLVVSAAELGFPVPPAPGRLRDALAALLEAEGLADAVTRITVTRGVPGGRPTRCGAWIEVEPEGARLWKGARGDGARVVFSKRPFHPGPLGRHKTTSRLAYSLAREEARAMGADEALLVGADGEVLEGAVSNLFVVAGGEVRTPPLARGILPGIVRAWVLSACGSLGLAAREAAIPRADLEQADEMFLTNSVQEVVPVAAVEDRAVRGREIGLRLRDAYRRMVRHGG
ncbi:MAG TPA: aminotransferase class IV [Candidatus Eisenbacteria bacterium]|jgi:branched-subunit amino acid aminotransferase/4-amino-4-deoxychorismate lyase